ncbi:nicotinate phosphoribosyltransferase [Pseudomonas aeruginosa]|uniref:Nicotinamide phosphoribosyltransferase n=4 Tax=Viruses TaxID=10239 RepID=A0A0A1IW62_9CAUD|nr:nicotinamide phosphoribosyl transferase [Pseudomonas phage vB_PaeM_C2-10_Ab02]CEF88952.1 putative Nicotinamide phosphoribosyltransferase [Pseudomonas phage vB_PaeM_C2-10_Ab02]
MKILPHLSTDGYKIGHGSMYSEGTQLVYSNLTPRSDKIYRKTHATDFYDGTLKWVGGRAAWMEIVESWEGFFAAEEENAVGRYSRFLTGYFGREMEAVEQLRALHKLGYLPLEVKSLTEGVSVPMGVPVLTIKNTLPEFYWLVNYHETLISAMTWKTATNATIAAEYAAMGRYYANHTGCYDDFLLSVQFHDFSARGMSGIEDAARSGVGHLTSFVGSDTLAAAIYAEDYYSATGLVACSVPATEHAVATSNILRIEKEMNDGEGEGGREEAERRFLVELMGKFPSGILSYVADSFDFWGVITDILPSIKDQIMERDGKLVVRPDSGDPVEVICGLGDIEVVESLEHWDIMDAVNGNDAFVLNFEDKYFKVIPTEWDQYEYVVGYKLEEVSEAQVKGAIQVLWETFGGTVNEAGYKMLDSHIGLIYGDSITTRRAAKILERLKEKGFASLNVVFGVGSYTYQCNTRDTFGFAVKATYTEVNGEGIAIFKDPKTDSKKKSAKGLLKVYRDLQNGRFLQLKDNVSEEEEATGSLRTFFKDGKWDTEDLKNNDLASIRYRIKNGV